MTLARSEGKRCGGHGQYASKLKKTELHLTREITRKLLSRVRDAVFVSASILQSRSTYKSLEIRKTDSSLELIIPL